MSQDKRDILEVLKFELSFLEQGGYGRSVRTPWKPTSIFLDSPSCINFNDSERPHPCNECALTDFVPLKHQEEEVPCHHIPLNPQGETVYSMERQREQIELEEALKNWLRETIQRIERERATRTERPAASGQPAAN
ncbi:MAG: CRISPR-associated protein Cas4 [Acidobacteriia bacterium]|nr:CRISPR-associated protein Cas4 [Terriglobia bacterium]